MWRRGRRVVASPPVSSRWSFLVRPKWLFGHLIVVVLVVAFVNLGFWQLRRLHQRRAFNHVVEVNEALPAADVAKVLPPGSPYSALGPLLDRRVRATGHYLVDEEVLISGQSLNGAAGAWIVTPLALDGGGAVLVNRGWVADNGKLSAPPPAARPPSGRVTVEGLLSETQTASGLEEQGPAGGHVVSLARIDVARIQRQLPQRLVPAFVQRTTQDPPDSGKIVPTTLPPPALDEGPHLSYAIQWFSFTALALIGYPFLIWRTGRDEERLGSRGGGGPDDDLPEGAVVGEDGVIDLTGVDRPV